jgi:hypothetical protein
VLEVGFFSKLKDQACDQIYRDQDHNQGRRDDDGFVTLRVKLIPQDKERQQGVNGINYSYHFCIVG